MNLFLQITNKIGTVCSSFGCIFHISKELRPTMTKAGLTALTPAPLCFNGIGWVLHLFPALQLNLVRHLLRIACHHLRNARVQLSSNECLYNEMQ